MRRIDNFPTSHNLRVKDIFKLSHFGSTTCMLKCFSKICIKKCVLKFHEFSWDF